MFEDISIEDYTAIERDAAFLKDKPIYSDDLGFEVRPFFQLSTFYDIREENVINHLKVKAFDVYNVGASANDILETMLEFLPREELREVWREDHEIIDLLKKDKYDLVKSFEVPNQVLAIDYGHMPVEFSYKGDFFDFSPKSVVLLKSHLEIQPYGPRFYTEMMLEDQKLLEKYDSYTLYIEPEDYNRDEYHVVIELIRKELLKPEKIELLEDVSDYLVKKMIIHALQEHLDFNFSSYDTERRVINGSLVH